MTIAGVASALPEYSYRQEEITEALAEYWAGRHARPQRLRYLHDRVGVRQRRLAFPLACYPQFKTWGETNRAWLKAAEELGTKAIDAVLGRAGLAREEIDALYVVSITGVASPSLDARLMNRMGLRADVKRTPIFGLGCVGGATGLVRAADHVLGYRKQIAVLLSVEICSLTTQLDDLSTANVIATGLFADGAVAVVVAGAARNCDGPEILGTRSAFYPGTEEIMGWDISEKGFRVVLSPKLPQLVRCRFAAEVDALLAEHQLDRKDVGSWIMHPGGPAILEAVQEAMGFEHGELELSWDCLARCGNLSSGSVLLVLEEVFSRHRPPPGTLGVIGAMGPGFCAELLLVRW